MNTSENIYCDGHRHDKQKNDALSLRAHNIGVRYAGKSVLNAVSMDLKPGEMLGLIGPNGAGKSSLLKCLAGVLSPDEGSVLLNERALNAWPKRELAQQLSYLEQGAQAYWPLSVRRIVELGRLPHLKYSNNLSVLDHQAVDTALALAQLDALQNRNITELSGGEHRRVMLARMLATQASILLADEPLAGLDLYHQLQTMALLRAHCQRGGSVLMVMHDLNLAARFCDRLALLHQGELVAIGRPETVLTEPRLRQVYEVSVRIEQLQSGLCISAISTD